MWNSIKGRKRCLVLCQGYFEWFKKGKDRIPYFIKHKDERIMVLAGLYDCVTLEDEKEPLWTFTIVTTDANKEFSWLHDRQPVILSTQKELDLWLDTSSQTWTKELSKLVLPYSNADIPLECYAVPKEVGKVGAESATFIEPISQRKDGIEAMFAKQKTKKPNVEQSEASSSSQPTIPLGSAKRRRLSLKYEEQEASLSDSDSPSRKKARKKNESDSEDTNAPMEPSSSMAKSKIKQESSDIQIISPTKTSTRMTPKITPKRSSAKAKAPQSGSSPTKITQFFSKDK